MNANKIKDWVICLLTLAVTTLVIENNVIMRANQKLKKEKIEYLKTNNIKQDTIIKIKTR